ncbi:hypothetical protein IKP85_04335 [bacterium]|nr:hypothetical protein [bacterium]
MDKLNLTNYAAKFSYKKQLQIQQPQPFAAAQTNSPAQSASAKPAVSPNPTPASQTANTPQMGTLASNETSVYVKDLMNLPKNLNEFVYMLQRGLNRIQMNRFLTEQYMMRGANNMTSERAQILAQLQGMSTTELQAALKNQLATLNSASSLKNLEILQNGMIKMSALAELLQSGGKDAIAKIILTMANASQQGVKDLSQLKDTAKLINASVAIVSQENSAQTLKALLLLYLPWLPLQEGTDFEIEIQGNPEKADSENILVITITTVNFGKVVATLVLETSNSVHVNIECSDKFPKEELMNRIRSEEKHYSMQSVLSFQNLEAKSEDTSRTKASVTMSSMDEINPYLLLMSHTIIRNTIIIDNEASNGVITHTD